MVLLLAVAPCLYPKYISGQCRFISTWLLRDVEGGGVGDGKFVDRITPVTISGLFVQSEAEWDFLGLAHPVNAFGQI